MNKKEIEQLALEYDRSLSSHPMSAVELRKDLTEFALQVVKKLNLPIVTNRAWIVTYTIDDSDVLEFNVTDAPNALAAKAVAMYGLPRKAKLIDTHPVLHGG